LRKRPSCLDILLRCSIQCRLCLLRLKLRSWKL